MATYQKAVQKLIPPGSNDPRIKARVGILHVDAGDAPSLFSFFKYRSGGIESHFHSPKVNPLEQYRDTDYEADANYKANPFALSVETQGYGHGKWNEKQLNDIKGLMKFGWRVHGIPFRKVSTWDDLKGGWGYHVMFGAPGAWTPVSKSCPGPERIRQFHEVLVPWMDEQRAIIASKRKVKTLSIQHVSLQFSDSVKEMEHDVHKMFSTHKNILSWTEASKSTALYGLIKKIAPLYGYSASVHEWGTGVAVKNNFGRIVDTDYKLVIKGVRKQYGNRGILSVEIDAFSIKERINVAAVHYITKGDVPSRGFRYLENKRFANEVSEWAKANAKGKVLCFVNGDFNINDAKYDVFMGGPLLTCWDELQKWPNTGHGPIDAIASFNDDIRVSCRSAKVFNDQRFFLNTDHFMIQAVYEVK